MLYFGSWLLYLGREQRVIIKGTVQGGVREEERTRMYCRAKLSRALSGQGPHSPSLYAHTQPLCAQARSSGGLALSQRRAQGQSHPRP